MATFVGRIFIIAIVAFVQCKWDRSHIYGVTSAGRATRPHHLRLVGASQPRVCWEICLQTTLSRLYSAPPMQWRHCGGWSVQPRAMKTEFYYVIPNAAAQIKSRSGILMIQRFFTLLCLRRSSCVLLLSNKYIRLFKKTLAAHDKSMNKMLYNYW